jgi:hypothetical protein
MLIDKKTGNSLYSSKITSFNFYLFEPISTHFISKYFVKKKEDFRWYKKSFITDSNKDFILITTLHSVSLLFLAYTSSY